MTNDALITFYGGTFDPIHYGHLKPVISLARFLDLKKIIILISNIPLYRSAPIASFWQRVEMVRLATIEIANNLFIIDKQVLHKSSSSWIVEIFKALRRQHGITVPIAFIIGQDSLLTLPTWKYSWELSGLCHLLVCTRPGYSNQLTDRYHNYSLIKNPNILYKKPSGLIYCATTPKFTISSSNIRTRYQANLSCESLLPVSVQAYIDEQGLYR
ncbi:nicotinate-nucleotide adenylyltransferase [Candidatus Curculioniphilus buchneri]|uniref:nicotinate-nucleotide adenylyltransferase n=1 Tax=Candidatus Curculioniphilus buchneri TaxID=690594 RepID=UPI00376F4010